jgi:class 3 adenylate cyclase
MTPLLSSDSSLDFRPLPDPGEGSGAAFGVPSNEPLAVVDISSACPLPEFPYPTVSSTAVAQVPLAAAEPPASPMFWLDGDALMCACPECRAPMSVRLWLMVADCWRCQTSIELS